jgi:predicted anti-sigma-YlaC factor YlaD
MRCLMGWLVGSCEKTEGQLSERLDGELHGRQRFSVARHLLACPHCRSILVSLSRTVTKLRDLGGSELPPPSRPFVEAISQRVRADRQPGSER